MRRAIVLASLYAGLLAVSAGGEGLAATKPKAAAPSTMAPAAPANAGKPVEVAAAPTPEQQRLTAQARLGLDLIGELARAPKPPENIVVSPASLASPLALLDLGASAPMRAAIHKTLGLDRPGADAAADLEALRAALALVAKPQGGPLAFASAVVFDPAAKPFPLAVLGLQAAGAEVSTESLDDPKTLERINTFVSDTTKGLIPTILDQPLRAGGLVALNALHFKDDWKTPFDARLTQQEPFTPAAGAPDKVSMMHSGLGAMQFRQDDHFIAVSLPYVTKGYSLVVVTTKDKPARAEEFHDAGAWLAGEGFAEAEGEVALPRFSLSVATDLLDAADKLGLKPARLSKTALAGLSPTPQVIAEIVQKAVIRVDEKGTEAAAATAVTTLRSLPAPHIVMKVDKPFLFALRQSDTGLVLMAGYVGRPEEAK
ncbi:serpin family protein [Labrys wisconsinensis]|uniref:Serpin B n=1 Tax=Labrys wisconsinensis TaxID=425677 RepID=A0ABU0IZE1_9HYPH|nr:serpin family protein [Labrys wisconsinensis]MDQ0467382.1 serpin B [Labrys wisconsinensis]